ncbi:serine/threonine-protein kinase 16-like [Ornithodoros turicata]|uniref:serine/threonine-protein kinase 16-like n=1 Tax=Ornithodoros turicata TaxID=34597 RepID=UPI003139422A
MNSLGWGILFSMGCTCSKETVCINGKRYTIKSRIGEGGFSIVDLIVDSTTHTTYALKRIPCHTKEDERNALREAEYYSSFEHPNLIHCLDVVLAEKQDFTKAFVSEVLIVLPYYRKGTLQDELLMRSRTRDHMSEERLLRLFHGMCLGVQALHGATPVALAHRDLKPSNVLMGDDDCPVWMDFGSMGRARLDINKTSEAIALQDLAAEKCSMPYRAPELFNVESHTSIDERIDIWSLGCCLYAMCFFRSPFEAAHERGDSVALAVLSGHVDFPEDSPYSGGVHGIIRMMLEVDSLQRPFIETIIQSVKDVASRAENKA